ncbi:pentapeptide repeat-containing protein [Granulicella aggregans]|nr:pentapeptide repeat-containing protein [Granulicella aggregans]
MLVRRKDGTVLADTDAAVNKRDLRDAVIRGLFLRVVDFSDSDLRRSDFSNAHLYGTYLYRANCAECSFKGALLQGVVLDEAIFSGADFEGAQLIPDAMGTPCTLFGADLKNANLATAILTGCKYDSTTSFPVGFSPENHGMVRKD